MEEVEGWCGVEGGGVGWRVEVEGGGGGWRGGGGGVEVEGWRRWRVEGWCGGGGGGGVGGGGGGVVVVEGNGFIFPSNVSSCLATSSNKTERWSSLPRSLPRASTQVST